uniref:EGF-like domain-containing protein n=1 Tax=Trichuris muris TaxID=70415 RepID=A0A5S6R663_TRIMR
MCSWLHLLKVVLIGRVVQSVSLTGASEEFTTRKCPHEVDKSIYGIRIHSISKDSCVTLVDKSVLDVRETLDLVRLSNYCASNFPSGVLLNVQTLSTYGNKKLLDLIYAIRFTETAKIFSGVSYKVKNVTSYGGSRSLLLTVKSITDRENVVTVNFSVAMFSKVNHMDLIPNHKVIAKTINNPTEICHSIFISNTTESDRFYGRTFPCVETKWNMFGCIHQPFRDCQLIKETDPYACLEREDGHCFLWHRIFAKQQPDMPFGRPCPVMSHFGDVCKCPVCGNYSWTAWTEVDGDCGTKIQFHPPSNDDALFCAGKNRTLCCAQLQKGKSHCFAARREPPTERNCTNGASPQLDFNGNSICICPYGFYGESCERKMQCTVHGCLNEGTCNLSTERCNCPAGYTGTLCESDVDDCLNNSCAHDDTCVDDVNSTVCACHYPHYYDSAWWDESSFACHRNMERCNYTACNNRGQCIVVGDQDFCDCHNGYHGSTCAIEPTDCYNMPCKHGYCRYVGDKYFCVCNTNYTGSFCEIGIHNCEKSWCSNGGTCKAVERGFVCSCLPGFFGPRCEYASAPCMCNPCENGGTCQSVGSTVFCKCPPDFWGKHCETRKFRPRAVEKPLSEVEIFAIVVGILALVYGFILALVRGRFIGKETEASIKYYEETSEAEEERREKILEGYRRRSSLQDEWVPSDTKQEPVAVIVEDCEETPEHFLKEQKPEDGLYRATDPMKLEEKASFAPPTEREKTCLSSESDPDFTGDTASLLGRWRVNSPILGYKRQDN